MDGTAHITQPDRTDRHRFDNAGMTGDLYHVTSMDRILKQNEHTGDHVLDQSLCPKSDSKPNHAGTSQQRSDVETKLRQHRHRHDDRQHNSEHVTQQRQQGTGPVAACNRLAVRTEPGEISLDQGAEYFPCYQGDAHD